MFIPTWIGANQKKLNNLYLREKHIILRISLRKVNQGLLSFNSAEQNSLSRARMEDLQAVDL